MLILGIETSCDETAASVVEDGRKVLSHVLASSAEMHTKTGGIIPEVAAREQLKSILPVISEALNQAFPNYQLHTTNYKPPIDAIAITFGPGLIGSLLVGVETAKTLSWIWKKPLIPVNHLIGHIYANFISECQKSKVKSQKSKLKTERPKFPALALVVSGGHTDLVLMQNHGKVEWIGGTRDDAAGEAFDKTARLLGLSYPGGPAIAAQAAKFEARNPKFELKLFPRPMIDEDNSDWSFSGLKTAVAREVKKYPAYHVQLPTPMLAAETQEAIVDSLVIKTIRAVKKFKPKSLLLGGGVAANQRLKEKIQYEILNTKYKIQLHIPSPKFCTDNASMIAAATYYNYHPVPWQKVKATPEVTIIGEV